MTKPPRKKPAKAGAKKVSRAVRRTPAKANAIVSATRRQSSGLAGSLARRYPGMRGYTRPNLFRMRQFHEAYRRNEKVSPLVRKLPWTHHLIILSQAKPPETRELYMLAAIRNRWTKRELERQIQSAAILRSAPGAKKVSPAVAQIHPTAIDELKNAYFLEFLSLEAAYSEPDLHGALSAALRRYEEFWAESGMQDRAFLEAAVFRMLRRHCEAGHQRLREQLRNLVAPSVTASALLPSAAEGAA